MPVSGDNNVRIGRERATPIASLRGASTYPHSHPRQLADTGRVGSLQVSTRNVTS
jgi:hypothetical protein